MMNFACFFYITYDDNNGFLLVKALSYKEEKKVRVTLVNKYGITTILASPKYW